MRSGALEAHNTLRLLVAVGDVVGVVTHVLLSSVGQALVARGLVGHSMGTLRFGPYSVTIRFQQVGPILPNQFES